MPASRAKRGPPGESGEAPPEASAGENAADARLLEDLSPEEFLDMLQGAGAFEGQEETLARLRVLAAQGIHPMQVLQANRVREEEPRERMLSSFDIAGIAKHMVNARCRRVVVLCGAGLSTSAGIPDFRTPGTGLYDNLQKYNLSMPELIFDLDFFRQEPRAFYDLCSEIWPGKYEPTPAHYFIRLLEDKGVLLRCYTQNIDSLECLAGLPQERLVAAHGNFDAAHVIDSRPEKEVDISELREALAKGEPGWQALKEKHGNLVKPKIVFFGESLPDRFCELRSADLESCDLLLVLGTSLVVQPFAGLVGEAAPSAPRLLVNREPAGTVDVLELGFRYNLTEEGSNWRDVWYEGDCDSGCRSLATALGWEAELQALIDSHGAAAARRASWVTEGGEPR